MARYALIHGAGDVGWYWHLVEGELRRRGHTTVAPDLPIEDDEATLSDHAAVVLDAIARTGGEGELVIVGQSFGGDVAPIVAERATADLLVLVAAMIPQPGESADEMWEVTGWRMPPGDTIAVFTTTSTRRWRRWQWRMSAASRRPCPEEIYGRSTPGRTSRPDSSCAATTASSRPAGCARSCVIG